MKHSFARSQVARADMDPEQRQSVKWESDVRSDRELSRRTEAEPLRLVDVRAIEPHVGDRLTDCWMTQRDGGRVILTRQKEIDKSVVIEIACGDVFECGRRKK